jgi:hypothetical protein
MAELSEGQAVWAPDPEGGGEVRAIYHEVIVGEPIEVNGRLRDAAWCSYAEGDDEGLTFRAVYEKLRPREE